MQLNDTEQTNLSPPEMSDSSDALFDNNICPVIFQDTFNNPAVYITENGFSQVGELQIEDAQRSQFYKDTISEMAKGNSWSICTENKKITISRR